MEKMRPAKPPRFFWQGVLILLPVALLAIVSLASLRHDEQAAERDARQKAEATARIFAKAFCSSLGDELHDFIVLQNEWAIDLRLACQPSVVQKHPELGVEFPNPNLEKRIKQWDRKYPTLKFADLALPDCDFLADGRTINLPDIFSAPTPPKWFQELSPEQLQLWQTARQLEISGNDPAAAKQAFENFLKTEPPLDAELAAQYSVRQIDHKQFTRQEIIHSQIPQLQSDTGIPFHALACYRALQVNTNEPLSPPLINLLWRQVIDEPSFVSPTLLDLAEAQTNRADAVAADQVRYMRLLWSSYLTCADWIGELLSIQAITNWMATGKQIYLLKNEPGVLAFLQPTTFQNMGSEKSPISGPGYIVWFARGKFVDAAFRKAQEETSFLVPDYLSVSIDYADAPAPTVSMPLFASATEKFGKHSMYNSGTITARFYLADKSKILAAEKRRAVVTATIIAGAALAAMIGFVTARRAFFRQLQLNQMKSNFVSSVSHELRAPIAAVRLLAESLERGKIPGQQKQNEYFRFIVQECRRLSSLIENVLDFSRIEQGRKRYESEPTDLAALVEQTVKLIEPYAAERGVKLEMQTRGLLSPSLSSAPSGGEGGQRPGEEASVEKLIYPLNSCVCDGMAIQQALVNLIDNAIKHSPADFPVKIGLEATAKNILLWVEDSGPGIPPNEHEKIFEQFYRRGSELRRETQGVGIGLTIVKHIAEAHGGRVVVRSAPGEGSRFTIELPVKNELSSEDTK